MADDERWMREAIAVARTRGGDPSCSPLGAVIVHKGRILSARPNQAQLLPDATAHAEMMAIRCACEAIGGMELCGATLYSTLCNPAACAPWPLSGRRSVASSTVPAATTCM